MADTYTPPVQGTGVKATIQRIGGHLAGMIMPNIGAFIAWGLITALFIPTGWLPNKELAELVGPIITNLLPILIGYTGGRMVHGQRGAVVGAVATMGVVVGSDVPMFLGAMIVGPLAAFILKHVDRFAEERTKAGFEMLVDNFTAGIVGGAMAVAGVLGIGPVVRVVTTAAGDAVSWLITHNLLPLASLLIEPAKVLFLNNAINHGVLGPLGVAEAARTGQSILFMLESNPGPGLGLLLAYLFFGPRLLRPSVPAAIVIQFFGGIHEIYFPYVLMKPRLIVAVIAGGAAGVFTFMATGAGLVATPSPGSIFAYLAVTPRGGLFGVILGVVVSAAVSFLVASVLLGFGRGERKAAEEGAAEQPPAEADGAGQPAEIGKQDAPSKAEA
ncbi:PTS mannitol transporter subunit IICB [Thermoactinospora rubra]|uniref:PTS mannitol transporter subunit IICB n=1 Tax=Thermoactinospora rubra TaxID=1088767 RepID=UPI000A10A54E|nr:PTS mannitol transporter subunit IICB [Thermoactinospora rubra]